MSAHRRLLDLLCGWYGFAERDKHARGEFQAIWNLYQDAGTRGSMTDAEVSAFVAERVIPLAVAGVSPAEDRATRAFLAEVSGPDERIDVRVKKVTHAVIARDAVAEARALLGGLPVKLAARDIMEAMEARKGLSAIEARLDALPESRQRAKATAEVAKVRAALTDRILVGCGMDLAPKAEPKARARRAG